MQGNLWKFDAILPMLQIGVLLIVAILFLPPPQINQSLLCQSLIGFQEPIMPWLFLVLAYLYKEDMSANISENINRNEQAIYGIWDNETNRVTDINQLLVRSFESGLGKTVLKELQLRHFAY